MLGTCLNLLTHSLLGGSQSPECTRHRGRRRFGFLLRGPANNLRPARPCEKQRRTDQKHITTQVAEDPLPHVVEDVVEQEILENILGAIHPLRQERRHQRTVEQEHLKERNVGVVSGSGPNGGRHEDHATGEGAAH